MLDQINQFDLEWIARKACWNVEVDFRDPKFGDPVVFVGQGIPDLDSLISRLQNYEETTKRMVKMRIDAGRNYSRYLYIGIPDLQALRATYISIWGDVAKPQFPYEIPNGDAIKI